MTGLCAVFVCTNTIDIRFVKWTSNSGSMMDTTESKSASERRLKELKPSKSRRSACIPNK